MTPGWAAIVVALIALLSSGLGAWASTQASRRSIRTQAEMETLRVDAEAYARARDSYDAALREQEARIARLHDELRAAIERRE